MMKLTLWTGTVVNARTDALNTFSIVCCVIVDCAFKNVSVVFFNLVFLFGRDR